MRLSLDKYYDNEGIKKPQTLQKIPYAHIGWIQPQPNKQQFICFPSNPKEKPIFLTQLEDKELLLLERIVRTFNPTVVKVWNWSPLPTRY